jgi:hypothetical protein
VIPSRRSQTNMVVQRATRMHHTNHHHIIRQNMMRRQMMNRALLSRVAQQVAPAAVEDLQELVEISRTAEPQGLDFAQVVARIQESTPFAALIELLPRDRAELYAFLALLLMVIEMALSQRPQPEVKVVTPDQVEHIIEQVIEHQQSEQPESPPTTQPDCDQKPHSP